MLLIGPGLGSIDSFLELAGTGSVRHGGSAWTLLTEDTSATSTPLSKSYYISVGKMENKVNLG